MKLEPTASPSVDQSRCKHCTDNGRRCRLPVLENSAFCFRHAALRDQQSDATDLSSAFGDTLSAFNTAVEIHNFLAKLTTLLVHGRVSCRRASVLAFCNQLLLRTLPAIEHELNPENDMSQVIADLPRPDRSHLAQPPSHPVLSGAQT